MGEQESKKQILKSTGILGSAQLIIILIGMIRVKVLAVLLGATGVGIAGLYQTTIDLIKSVTGLGIGYSAVRNIAASANSNNKTKIAATILVLKRWTWATGLLGMVITIVCSSQLSIMAFGDTRHALSIGLLSICLLLTSVASGHLALLQGLRKIGAMAKANVFSAILGLIGSILIYYFLGLQGIVPAFLLIYIITLLTNWFFSKKIRVVPIKLTTTEIFNEGTAMVKLGFFLTIAGLLGTATMYFVRSFVSKQSDLNSVGHFVAAWSISSMYISAIFGAMGADFFPRLSSVQHDHIAVTKLVNEQTEIAILITAPIIIAMVSFIDLVVRIFYSTDFAPTAGILDWQLTGDLLKVLAWPMGFIMLAKGKGKLYLVTEICWNVLYCVGVYLGWKFFGIQSTGIAFLLTYVLYTLLVYVVARKLVRFKWSGKVRKAIFLFLPLILMSLISVKNLAQPLQYITGVILTAAASIFSFHRLKGMVDFNSIGKRLKIIK